MARINFDLDVLRSFVTGIELGSFAQAADRLGRSTSAISAQLKKLEEQAGAPVLRKSGRGLVLTPAGEALLAYARGKFSEKYEKDNQTPMRLSLPSGEFEITVAGPTGQEKTDHVKISAKSSGSVTPVFEQLDVEKIVNAR